MYVDFSEAPFFLLFAYTTSAPDPVDLSSSFCLIAHWEAWITLNGAVDQKASRLTDKLGGDIDLAFLFLLLRSFISTFALRL